MLLMSTDSTRLEPVVVLTPSGPDGVYDRHALVPGFDQSALARCRIGLIGLGAAGSEVGRVLVRKGVGTLIGVDYDPAVEVSNLPRQFYYADQVGQPKAHLLPHNLAREASGATTITGYACSAEEALPSGLLDDCTALVVAVDRHPTRAAISRFCRERGMPALFTAFSDSADRGYVFVQEAAGACWGCLFPGQATDPRAFPCSGATNELPAIAAGLIAYAIDSLVMARPRTWNYRELSLAGGGADATARIARRPDCPLCGDH